MRVVLVAALILVGCATPSKVATSMDIGSVGPNLTTVTIRIKNTDVRASTPLLVELTIQTKNGRSWSKPELVLHPAAFVLKKQEEQILRATTKVEGQAVRATLTVREQETGRQIQKTTEEKTIS